MIAIIDYGMGNVQSVKNALEMLGYEVVVSRDESIIDLADKLILPGVGAFGDGMYNLKNFGLIPILNRQVLEKKKPILGICLGMQLFGKDSEENKGVEGLGWIDASVKRFDIDKKHNSERIKVPHVGWNNIVITKKSKILSGITDGSDFYFVHSFCIFPNNNFPNNNDVITSVCNYGCDFVATIQKDNIYATQFHPEKSQSLGLKILENFVENA